ncbi:MAG: tetratricopeptide repeat protein [Algisphaera sp.]
MKLFSQPSTWALLATFALPLAVGLPGCATSGSDAGGGITPQSPSSATGSVPDNARVAPAFAVTPEQRVKAAELLRDAGQLDAAMAEFNRVLETNPQMVEAHVGVGTVQHKKEQYQEAKETFLSATLLDNLNFDARYYLGLMQQVLGETGEAIASYRQALAIDPDDAVAHRDLATAYLQLGQPSMAIPHAEASVRLNPKNQPAWCNLAATYSLVKRYDDALHAYRTATELADLDAPVLLGLGDTHLKLNNIRRAVNALNELVRRFPSGLAFERLAYALFRSHNFPESNRHYRTSLEYDPKATAALNGLGACLITEFAHQRDRRDQAKLREAMGLWRKSVQIDRDQEAIVDLLSRYDLPG